jgi:hypothetical protein
VITILRRVPSWRFTVTSHMVGKPIQGGRCIHPFT